MRIESCSEKETLYLGKALARNLRQKDVVCLFGQLGSGKTVLAKGVALGLGITKEEITSPTFILIHEYLKGRLPLYHFDLYRLEREQDILQLGYEEYIYGDGVSVIEWADRLRRLIPKEHLKINLEVQGENKRKIELVAVGQRYQELINYIRGRFPCL
ncbi:MAG: tRNA (adenosine(37)-N6)-threonylcarbamoyltransferase complex ATPase subunit type 1 TsaE [Candidatus Omnitrophica bacterium]|nr:tRNA (adenosine(37)-N6)-threonylcarbamoyltransferase complex ATPase subunit type 1 TsaE [Candidatus Omnitrophota bacterium]